MKVNIGTCKRQLFDEEIHARLPAPVQEQGNEHSCVTEDDDGKQDPKKHKLFCLEEWRF